MIDNQAAHTAVRSVLRHHKLTQHGDSVVEADLIAAVMSAVSTDPKSGPPSVDTDLLSYVLQDDLQNRLTPRIIDIAYTAFMAAKKPNDEDGGASDWFTDTRPVVKELIEKLRKDLVADQSATIRIDLSRHQIDTLVQAYLGDCGPQANSIYAFVRAVSALTYSVLVQISDKEDTQCTDVINTSADSADGAVVTTTGAPPIQTTRPTLEQTAMDRTRDLAESGGRWPSDWVEAYSRGVSDTVRAQCLPNIEQSPSTYWDAFVEELRKDVGVDHVASIIGGVTKLKALYLRAAGMVKPDPDPVPDPHLLKFYNVATTSELIAAQARHIERLQAKLSTTPSLVPQQVREG